MLLAVDIGNSNIVFGFYDGKKLLTTLRIATDHARTSDESAMILSQFMELKRLPAFEAMVIASVVPKLEAVFRHMAEGYYHLEPLFVSPKLKLNITFDYPQPSEIGTDRICDAVAAYDRFGGPTIIVDFGTATTFGVVSEQGAFLGGDSPGDRDSTIGAGISSSAAFQNIF